MVGRLKGMFFALKSIKCLCQKNTQLVANVKEVALEHVYVNHLKKALGNVKLRNFLELPNSTCFFIL